jgi:hypothetical protein
MFQRLFGTHSVQVLLSGHFILFFSLFLLLIMFSIFPVMFLCIQPADSNPRPKDDAGPAEPPSASEPRLLDACDAAALPKQDVSPSEPGMLSLAVCILSAAAVLLSRQA